MVMAAPGGLASLVLASLRLAAHGRLRALLPGVLALAAAGVAALAGASAMVEMLYHLRLDAALGPVTRFGGLALDASGATAWMAAAALAIGGGVGFEVLRRRFARRWGEAGAALARADAGAGA
jgi:branched-chain amino acid transport system permease protein